MQQLLFKMSQRLVRQKRIRFNIPALLTQLFLLFASLFVN
jgi:hypothetical protein